MIGMVKIDIQQPKVILTSWARRKVPGNNSTFIIDGELQNKNYKLPRGLVLTDGFYSQALKI